MLSVNIGALAIRKAEGHKWAAVLLDIKQHRIDDAISAILTLNTIAHTTGAAVSGAQAAVIWGDAWVGVFSGVLTLLILVFTEIIPKTLGTTYAVPLADPVGLLSTLMIKFMTPILFGTRLITKIFTRDHNPGVTKGEISAMLALAENEGEITSEQSKVATNLLHYDRLSVTDVMTPRPVITMLHKNLTLHNLLDHDEIRTYSRIPIYDQDHDDIKGYVMIRQIWAELARGGDANQSLSAFMHPIHVLPKSYSVGEALRLLTQKHEHLAVVLDEYGGVSGLITLEDLFETILGVEITDELDQIVDLREAAIKIRDQRLARMARSQPPLLK